MNLMQKVLALIPGFSVEPNGQQSEKEIKKKLERQVNDAELARIEKAVRRLERERDFYRG